MNTFNNVTVIKAANIYFDGMVTSRTLRFADGSEKTLGIMLPGEYSFDTAAREEMEIIAGALTVLLPGNTDWQTFKAGDRFEIPANSKFDLKVSSPTDYCCSYLA